MFWAGKEGKVGVSGLPYHTSNIVGEWSSSSPVIHTPCPCRLHEPDRVEFEVKDIIDVYVMILCYDTQEYY